jgi:hypothetical protein
MASILRWLLQLIQRSGIMPHLPPCWRIFQIRMNAVRPRRPRHGRHQNFSARKIINISPGLPAG